ncbi:hydroquinone glucosyltransferase-like [Phragmites australis]|uniref:hydroquinone glucosyltransferase-like n=1 Tax=Phragmites australis TaxID=29695 RepID=UPI002D7A1AAE|nr:hydroquinone glucosyltransferase-like [Phragmites australis]
MGGVQESTPACTARPRVLLLCSPCMGHLIPFAELARRLVSDHGLAATLLFAAATSPPSAQYLAVAAAAVSDRVDLVALPAPPPGALPPSAHVRDRAAHVRDRAAHAVASNVRRVRELARALAAAAPLAALVVDMVGVPARDVATELGVPFYMLFTSPWMTLSLFLHLPELDATRAGEHRDAAEPICLPGCVPIHAHELPSSMLADRNSNTYSGFLSMAKKVTRVDGILVNTFSELEPGVGNGMDGLGLPVYPVGPLVWTRPVGVDRDNECLKWLDQQPRGSVVYISFGSGGTLTWQQTAELALGLELSQRRFIWAAKRPQQDTAMGAFFGTKQGEEDMALDFLPEGFIERTRGLGLVLPSWAPQTAILSHPSVRCFVTHCGWNSTLESVMNGVPMVAWPLYAEQNMNAAMMEVQVGVAARVKVGPDRFITKEEVASAIQHVMEGKEAERMREWATELREKSVHALSKGGSSTHALAHIVNMWKQNSSGRK